MTILSIVSTEPAGQVGVLPRIIKLECNDTFTAVTASGYLSGAQAEGFSLYQNDFVFAAYDTTSNSLAILTPSFSNGVPTLSNAFVGTVNNNGQSITTTFSSAAPTTIHALDMICTNSVTTMTSGTFGAGRGSAHVVSASGGIVYGLKGKTYITGTVTSTAQIAGVFGQLDISAATLGTPMVAAVWGDYGTTGTSTTYAGATLFAGTNNTASILGSQIYLFGGATNLLEVVDNNAVVGSTYFLAAGTGSGSAGNTTHCDATKVLTISVNSTTYYIPLFAQNT